MRARETKRSEAVRTQRYQHDENLYSGHPVREEWSVIIEVIDGVALFLGEVFLKLTIEKLTNPTDAVHATHRIVQHRFD